MEEIKKANLIAISVLAVIWIAGIYVMQVDGQNSEPETKINQEISVNDEIFKTIHVQLEDGVSSSDDIR